MWKLTIQLLGYIGWIHDFLLSNGCWFGLYIYTWLYPLHYFHEIYPRPVPSPLRRNVSLGQRPSGPGGILVPKQPKDGMNGWGQKHIWLNPGRTYYELLWISVFDLLYIYIHITYFFMCHVLLEGLTCWWQRICSGFFGRTIGRVFYNLHQCRGRTNSGDTACRGSTEVSVCIISKERSSQARIWILQQWQALPYQRKRNQLPKFQTAFTFPCLVDTVKPSQSWPPQHPQPWRAIPWGQTVVFPPFFPIVSAT